MKKDKKGSAVQSKAWYRLMNKGSDGAEVLIYDEIGTFGVTAQDFINDLAQTKGPVTLRLNTPGGEVFDGIAIYNALRSRGNVSVTIDGIAASIGSVIAMAASPGQLSIARRASMMIHDGFSQATGNAQEMRELADLLDQQSDNIAGIYSDRTGKPADFWRNQMKTETWYVGDQAVDAGLADQVVDLDQNQAKAAKSATAQAEKVLVAAGAVLVDSNGQHKGFSGAHNHSHQAYGTQGGDNIHSHMHNHSGDSHHGHHVSNEVQTDIAAKTEADIRDVQMDIVDQPRTQRCPKCDAEGKLHALFCHNCGKHNLMAADSSGWVQATDGSWKFDPDGDGDDDSTPGGDTDHDYWDADGDPVPGKTVPPHPHPVDNFFRETIRAATIDNSPWDASKVWKAGSAASTPSQFFASVCAGRRAGNPNSQTSWALPYKYSPSSPPNANAVRAALAALGGARGTGVQGLTNRPQAQSLLEKLMKQINPDYEPSSNEIDSKILQSLFTSMLEPSESALEGSEA